MKGFITVIDFETTSLQEDKRATEIGLVALDDQLEVVATYESLIAAPIEPTSGALKVSRLTKSEIRSAPLFEELWPGIAPFFSGRVLVAHNAAFEYSVLQQEFGALSVAYDIPPMFCTLEAAKMHLTHAPSKTLPDLCAHLNIPLNSAHEALSDALATAGLLRHLFRHFEAVPQIVESRRTLAVTYSVTGQAAPPAPRIRDAETESFGSMKDVIAYFNANEQRQFILTGEPKMGKADFAAAMSKIGLYWQESAPSKKTLFVVKADEGAGVSKIAKAREKGIPIVTESQALRLLEELG